MHWCEAKRFAQNHQKWKAKVDTYAFHGTKMTC